MAHRDSKRKKLKRKLRADPSFSRKNFEIRKKEIERTSVLRVIRLRRKRKLKSQRDAVKEKRFRL